PSTEFMPTDRSIAAMNALHSSVIIRSLERLLDQLHYWARRAQEPRTNVDNSALATRMLETATANLEAFVTMLLDYFRPLHLRPPRMSPSGLASCFALRAWGDSGAVGVTVSGVSDGIVSVDVAQLTRAVSAIFRRLDSCGARLDVTIALAERGGRRG